jgi:hypothetical protein
VAGAGQEKRGKHDRHRGGGGGQDRQEAKSEAQTAARWRTRAGGCGRHQTTLKQLPQLGENRQIFTRIGLTRAHD